MAPPPGLPQEEHDGRARTHDGVHERVLENLLDGVLVVERDGAITVFNAAAAQILGISQQQAIGRSFSELFVARAGFDAFSEHILDAVTGADGGRQEVMLSIGGETRTLSVATSYITAVRAGTRRPVALIAVFGDVTELHALRETEARMAETLKAQHAKLQLAYRQIEERNETLSGTLKKVQVARMVATVAVIAVFVGAGVYTWQPLKLAESQPGPQPISTQTAGATTDRRTLTVQPRPVRETITLAGKLAPWRTTAVASPVTGSVAAVHFEYGKSVAENDLLVEFDARLGVREHHEARVAYIEALKEYETVRDWESGPEMAGARRAFTRVRMSLERQENRLNRSRFLLEQGLIAASAHEDEEQQYRTLQLDFEAAREDLEGVRVRGDAHAVEAAELRLKSAEQVVEEFAAQIEKGRVHAPLSGVVLPPQRSGASGVVAGRAFGAGQPLLTIGDFSRMAATAKVDEIDVVRIAEGQEVEITGHAFPGLVLRGRVTRVASQPLPQSQGASQFEVEIVLDPLAEEQRTRLRAGMSSQLQIAVYSNPDALLVPIEAVSSQGMTHRLHIVDPQSGEVRERSVRVGPTTADSVEIVEGLKPGETILLSGGQDR